MNKVEISKALREIKILLWSMILKQIFKILILNFRAILLLLFLLFIKVCYKGIDCYCWLVVHLIRLIFNFLLICRLICGI